MSDLRGNRAGSNLIVVSAESERQDERGAEEAVLFALQRMSRLCVALAVFWLACHAAGMPTPIAWYSFEDSFVDSEVSPCFCHNNNNKHYRAVDSDTLTE